MKKVLAMVLVLLLCLSLAACGSSSQSAQSGAASNSSSSVSSNSETAPAQAAARHLKIHTQHPDGSPVVVALERFCKELEEKSGGSLTAEVFPSAQLSGGNQTTAIEMVQSGEIEIGVISNVVQCGMQPSLNLISIPFMWDDEAQIDRTIVAGTEAFRLFKEDTATKGMVLLGFAESGFREITNNVHPIRTPADMTNLKIRVLGNNMLNAAYTALGANPTDYNFNELYTALQQGTVDGQENPVSTIIVPQRYVEVQKYLTISRIAYDAQVVEMGQTTWDSLSEEQQKILQECIDEFIVYEKEENRARYQNDLTDLEKEGMQIEYLTEDEIKVFRDAVADVVASYIPQYNQAIYDAMMACK